MLNKISTAKKFLVLTAFIVAAVFTYFTFHKTHAKSFQTQQPCNDSPDEITRYACLVNQAAQGSATQFTQADDNLDVVKAIETMNLVQNIASSGRYSFLQHDKNFHRPDMPEQQLCLTNGFGICGNHQHLFIAILKKAGVQARPVDFYYYSNGKRANHAAAEVKIGKQWVYFDVTWGSFWIKDAEHLFSLLSLEDILQHKGLQITGTNTWYLTRKYFYDQMKEPGVFSYLTQKELQILKDKGGELLIGFDDGKVNFASLPNYIGAANGEPLNMKFSKQTPTTEATLKISGIGGACKKSNLKINQNLYPVKIGETKIKIAPNAIMSIAGNHTCYAVIEELTL